MVGLDEPAHRCDGHPQALCDTALIAEPGEELCHFPAQEPEHNLLLAPGQR